MAIDVTVLRVFTDADGNFGNPLGVVDASTVDAGDRQRIATELGYSETIFIDVPEPGPTRPRARIFTPAAELPFAGHPTVGASWWLRDRGTPVNTLQVPAGSCRSTYDGRRCTAVSARADWAPDSRSMTWSRPTSVLAADPDDYHRRRRALPLDVDRPATRASIRSRMFAGDLGMPEDEATGAAAVRITDYLSRDLDHHAGQGLGHPRRGGARTAG